MCLLSAGGPSRLREEDYEEVLAASWRGITIVDWSSWLKCEIHNRALGRERDCCDGPVENWQPSQGAQAKGTVHAGGDEDRRILTVDPCSTYQLDVIKCFVGWSGQEVFCSYLLFFLFVLFWFIGVSLFY